MKPGDLVQLFSRVDTNVWCWDENDNDYYYPSGTAAIFMRHGQDIGECDPGAIDQIICESRIVWVHRHQIEVIDAAG